MHQVKIIIADAGRTAAHAQKIISGISPYYAAKYRAIKVKQEACQELTAGFLLKHYLGVCDDGQLIRTAYGKPMLRAGKVYFNLSHSGDYVVLAIADMDIGVDMEQVMDVHWPSVRKVFSKKQQEHLEQTPERERPRQFTRMWTECEALLKLWGTGFAAETAGEHEGMLREHAGQSWESGGQCRESGGQPGGMVHWIEYGDYVITCAAYEEFYMSVEDGVEPME